MSNELLGTTDALAWAQEFMRKFGDRKEDIDEGLMLAWFANAMVTAVDEWRRTHESAHGDSHE
jgi:hypothetical protein